MANLKQQKYRRQLHTPRLHIAGLHRALKGVTHYLALKTLISLWTGLIVWLGLLAMGVQFALMWGVLAFLLKDSGDGGANVRHIVQQKRQHPPHQGELYPHRQQPQPDNQPGPQANLMWGVLAFLLNYVPNIGSAISAIPPMLQALLFSGIYECLLVGALFLVVHLNSSACSMGGIAEMAEPMFGT